MNIPDWIAHPPMWLICSIGLVFGLYLAKKAAGLGKNRNLWFMIGFLFGIYGLVAFWITKKRTKKQIQAPTVVVNPPEPSIRYSDAFWYYLDEAHSTVGPMSHSRIEQL